MDNYCVPRGSYDKSREQFMEIDVKKERNLGKLLYLCSRKAARTGCASAIEASFIAFGLHRPCTVKLIKR
jgi:hypothetical protein